VVIRHLGRGRPYRGMGSPVAAVSAGRVWRNGMASGRAATDGVEGVLMKRGDRRSRFMSPRGLRLRDTHRCSVLCSKIMPRRTCGDVSVQAVQAWYVAEGDDGELQAWENN